MNTKVNFCGVEFENPVVTGSGTFGFGYEYSQYYNLDAIGGISVKGLTLKPREGNKPPRIAEVYGGILNSVGLQNPGLENFLTNDLPFLKKKFSKCKIIANIAGNTIEDYIEMGKLVGQSNVDIVEMNISCPNVKHGGVAFGTDCNMVSEITSKVKEQCDRPLVVKLSPNVTDIVAIAKAAEGAGADGLSLINTLLGMKIDINSRRPILNNNVGGMSGPAVKPVAVRMVWQVANAVNIPIIGMGGICDGNDAVEFMLAGASLVSVGTQNFVDPYAAIKTANGIEEYMTKHGIEDVNELIGAVKPW
ncbi:MAG: dihydroorotate dehydrogenase [Clostridia bacterium]|nr:dihydroorotate dehydrogenase [Clostridia bacterium]